MTDSKTVIFNASGLEFGILFVTKSESVIAPIRDIAQQNNMILNLAGTSSDSDNVWVLSKGEERPNGHNFLKAIKDVCCVEKGWYPDHCRTDISYLMFMNEDSLAQRIEEANVEA